jgi:hypothetical protein
MDNDLKKFLFQAFILIVFSGIGGAIFVILRRRAHAEGEVTLYPPADVTRLALASLVLNGPTFRGLILRRLSNPFRALAPEPGTDFALVVAAAKKFDQEEQPYWWILALLVVTLPFFLKLGLLTPYTFLWLIAFMGVALRRRWRVRFHLATQFTRQHYNPDALRKALGVVDRRPVAEQPVVCHGTADPFVGMGLNQGGWNLAFDVRRPAPGRGMVGGDVDARGMDDTISHAIRRLAVPGLELDELMFVNGAQTLPVGLHSDPFMRPVSTAGEEQLGRFRHGADPAARVYRRAVVTDWSGELVLSYLFRCLRRGDVLVVEAVQLVLTPVGGEYRKVDTLRELGALGQLVWWARSVAAVPADIFTALRYASRNVADLVDEALFGGVEGRERREIRGNPAYNYGALWSLRSHIAAKTYASYFQKADAFQYFRAIDEQVLNAIRDCLDANGIDSTAMTAQAITIQNNTVQITSARDVTLSGVAIGAGASAQAARAPRRALAKSGAQR